MAVVATHQLAVFREEQLIFLYQEISRFSDLNAGR